MDLVLKEVLIKYVFSLNRIIKKNAWAVTFISQHHVNCWKHPTGEMAENKEYRTAPLKQFDQSSQGTPLSPKDETCLFQDFAFTACC